MDNRKIYLRPNTNVTFQNYKNEVTYDLYKNGQFEIFYKGQLICHGWHSVEESTKVIESAIEKYNNWPLLSWWKRWFKYSNNIVSYIND